MRSPIQRPLSSHLSWNISRLKLQRTVNVSPTRADHALTSAGGSAQPIATSYTVNKLSLSSLSSLIALARFQLIKRLLISSLNMFNSPRKPRTDYYLKCKWWQWRCHEQNVAGALYNVNKYATDALNLNTVPEATGRGKSLKTRQEEKGLQFLTKRQQWQSSSDWGEEGKPFHALDAATGKARSPRVERFVGATTNVSETEERRRWRPLTPAVRRRLSARYVGAVPWRPRYTKTHSRNRIRSGTCSKWSSWSSGDLGFSNALDGTRCSTLKSDTNGPANKLQISNASTCTGRRKSWAAVWGHRSDRIPNLHDWRLFPLWHSTFLVPTMFAYDCLRLTKLYTVIHNYGNPWFLLYSFWINRHKVIKFSTYV